MGSIFSAGLRDQHFGENGAQGSKLRQENRDQWVPDIPCYDPAISDSFAPARKSYHMGLVFTHKNGDFGAISATERSCAAPISKVERHISHRILIYRKVFRVCSKSYPVRMV